MAKHERPAAKYLIGVDVGTGSVRAALTDHHGSIYASHAVDISMRKPHPGWAEQSSDEIWKACCTAVRCVMKQAREVSADEVVGVGFDATCSLVLLDDMDGPVAASDKKAFNVIVWMDHRAIEQAERINKTRHRVLEFVGGTISPEMQSPKLLWLKEHAHTSFVNTRRFLDLPDFLTYRATGDDKRSACSTVCKWTYLAHETPGWKDDFWEEIGLDEFPKEGYKRIGKTILPMGTPLGKGLTAKAAEEMGLKKSTAVGVSVIDAHAGGIGLVGATLDGEQAPTMKAMERRLALIGGTSSCHMAVSREAKFVPGVWGPYKDAMIPGMWLTEGGQSATGALLDHIVHTHAQGKFIQAKAKAQGMSVFAVLNARLEAMAREQGLEDVGLLTAEYHVLPYFHGNRAPRADPTLRGMVCGLTLGDSVDDLALIYLAAIQALAHGTRHIIESLNAKGYAIDTIFATGGCLKNDLFLKSHADITGCRVVLSKETEAVLLGASVLGAVAAGVYGSLLEAMSNMNAAARYVFPEKGNVKSFHNKKYAVFLRMYEDQMAYKALMKG